jgi:hypothetical protein
LSGLLLVHCLCLRRGRCRCHSSYSLFSLFYDWGSVAKKAENSAWAVVRMARMHNDMLQYSFWAPWEWHGG